MPIDRGTDISAKIEVKIAESVTVSDSVAKLQNLQKALAESITTSDSVTGITDIRIRPTFRVVDVKPTGIVGPQDA